jgi:hypothetical protein
MAKPIKIKNNYLGCSWYGVSFGGGGNVLELDDGHTVL